MKQCKKPHLGATATKQRREPKASLRNMIDITVAPPGSRQRTYVASSSVYGCKCAITEQ